MNDYDAQELLWTAFEHPWLAIFGIFAAYLAFFHFAPALATSLGVKLLGLLGKAWTAFWKLLDNLGKPQPQPPATPADPTPGVPTPTPPAADNSATVALLSAQSVISYAVKHGDAQMLTTATAILPELQKAAQKTAAVALLFLTLACLGGSLGCSSAEQPHYDSYPMGAEPPPDPEQIRRLYGDNQPRTLSEIAPELIEGDTK